MTEVVVPAPRAEPPKGVPPPQRPPARPLDAGSLAAALAVLAFGLAGAGAGFGNGDAAVYAAQAAQGDLSHRVVHVGYIALAAVLGRVFDDLPVALDVVSALACAATTLGAGHLAATYGRPPWVAAALTGAMLLPIASFGEADPVWVALLVWAAAVRPSWAAAALVAAAVPISPLALLGLPWVSIVRWERVPDPGRGRWRGPNPNFGLWTAPIVVMLLLIILTGGDWWSGDRGITSAPWPRPWRAIQAWGAEGMPWWSLPLLVLGWVIGGAPGLLAPWPLILAPPDADAWPLFTVSAALIVSEGVRWTWTWSRRTTLALLLLASGDVVWGAWRHVQRVETVRAEEAAIAEVLHGWSPGDGLVAPWTWGVRASVRATGDPYALKWTVPGSDKPWCVTRTWTLPPGAAYPPLDCPESGPAP